MNLECLNGIITDNLAIQIDLTQLKSWDLNTGLTVTSLSKWNSAKSDNLELFDFGLTAYDNGRLNIMYTGITIAGTENKIKLFPVGYNNGSTGSTQYSGYTITPYTGTSVGNYFNLSGGYLQGFYKLDKYNYELFPPRYLNGITIETLIEILPNSEGIVFFMGTRAEDKYNQYFSGETTITGKLSYPDAYDTPRYQYLFSGVTTSENNYLNSYEKINVVRNAYQSPENKNVLIDRLPSQLENVSNNVIAFEITNDKKILYKYIDENGVLVTNTSPNSINRIGWTLIDIVFTPYDLIPRYDSILYNCYSRRLGDLNIYLNGRLFWKVKNFQEWYTRPLKNQREKQLGVPFNISWGGGSFGLKHSWHYDTMNYSVYSGQNSTYINNNFWIQNSPILIECESIPSDNYLPGLSLSANTNTFIETDKCTGIENNITVMSVIYTGTTGNTGGTASKYFVKFNHPIFALSNREYVVNLFFNNTGLFKTTDNNGNIVYSKATIIVYGSVGIDIISEIVYSNPLTNPELNQSNSELQPFPDRGEYQYMKDGVMYYGETGIPVIVGEENNVLYYTSNGNLITGDNSWKNLNCRFKTADNSGKQTIHIGLLIESTVEFNQNIPIYIKDFSYMGADILVQDKRKNNLLIEQYFNNSYIGNIQKLRLYDIALTPDKVLYNAGVEAGLSSGYGMLISKGGRIISTYSNVPYIPQQSAGSDIRKSIKYRNADGTYKNLYQMIDIMVVVKSKSNTSVELVKFKKVADVGWLALIYINDTTYDFIVPDTVTALHANEVLYAEIKFQWADPFDIDNVFDKIFVTDITTSTLLDNTVKNY